MEALGVCKACGRLPRLVEGVGRLSCGKTFRVWCVECECGRKTDRLRSIDGVRNLWNRMVNVR